MQTLTCWFYFWRMVVTLSLILAQATHTKITQLDDYFAIEADTMIYIVCWDNLNKNKFNIYNNIKLINIIIDTDVDIYIA